MSEHACQSADVSDKQVYVGPFASARDDDVERDGDGSEARTEAEGIFSCGERSGGAGVGGGGGDGQCGDGGGMRLRSACVGVETDGEAYGA